MPKLNDSQTILLSTAAQRESCSLYPLSDKLTNSARITKMVAGLLKLGLAVEQETRVPSEMHRSDSDTCFGVFVTAAGLHAIGIEPAAADVSVPAAKPLRVTKAAKILSLLKRDGGVTLLELTEVTGWLPHTTRAALTGLRKKGHQIKRDSETCYRIVSAA